jgi:hypothetical protein
MNFMKVDSLYKARKGTTQEQFYCEHIWSLDVECFMVNHQTLTNLENEQWFCFCHPCWDLSQYLPTIWTNTPNHAHIRTPKSWLMLDYFFNQFDNAIFRGLCLREQVKGHYRRPANRQASISEQDLRKRSSDPSWMKASTRSPTSQTWDPTATWWRFSDPLALLKQKGCIGLNFRCSTGCQSLVSAREQHRGNHSSSWDFPVASQFTSEMKEWLIWPQLLYWLYKLLWRVNMWKNELHKLNDV